MNRVNPLIVLLISVLIFIISFITLNTTKNNLEQNQEEFIKFKQTADKYIAINNTWDKEELEKKIKIVAKLSKLENIFIQPKDNNLNVIVMENDLSKIDKFLNNLLNKNFIIKEILISKNYVQIVLDI
jgi:hypothetical protein